MATTSIEPTLLRPVDKPAAISTTTVPLQLHVSEMGKGLDTIPPGSPYMMSINFSYNRIRSLPSYGFYFLGYKALHKIELSQNNIAVVSQKAFKELFLLRTVDLSGNNITVLETSTFKTNLKLEKLDLSDNKISFHSHKPFLNSLSLETLILSNNKIDQIYTNTFHKLPKLRNLMINSNFIFAIDVSAFAPLRQLQTLSLADTGLDRLSASLFMNNTYPRVIDLRNTPLANKFNPPLRIVKNSGVISLINIDNYF